MKSKQIDDKSYKRLLHHLEPYGSIVHVANETKLHRTTISRIAIIKWGSERAVDLLTDYLTNIYEPKKKR